MSLCNLLVATAAESLAANFLHLHTPPSSASPSLPQTTTTASARFSTVQRPSCALAVANLPLLTSAASSKCDESLAKRPDNPQLATFTGGNSTAFCQSWKCALCFQSSYCQPGLMRPIFRRLLRQEHQHRDLRLLHVRWRHDQSSEA
ncbi:hypothetical protein K437DRAFT_261967 [Tilletiaria anomala UBC 951]|uniref:Uncharacterized protein n=1 Tax=Tilletiaria anomala (strain ATCC 24038 / CBS 436.72 / UBC 951) TaxID=1037660 RepID=A0A066WD19_TILAU|nr:uncharacterized protein K437DRAFT_261967 [Tilletiaria anomala UBC 951]KDN50418.1 hypothetical protein K437DRAFT_261967 [Tilletiaria anomala UBC 951]